MSERKGEWGGESERKEHGNNEEGHVSREVRRERREALK